MTIYDKLNISIPQNCNFYMGYGNDIVKNLSQKKDNSIKFPAIILHPEFTEKEDSLIFNEFDLTFYICDITKKNLDYVKREEQIFEGKLKPLLRQFQENMKCNEHICTAYDNGKFKCEIKRLPFTGLDDINTYIVDVLQVDMKDVKIWI